MTVKESSSSLSTVRQEPVAPLKGIKVLDFTHVLAGPFCSRLLADFGADVVRVESTKHPDRWGKGIKKPGFESQQDRQASYLNTNRSKRSICIDLKNTAGRDLAARLAVVADVVLENFSAGVMERLKLDYDSLQPLNPRLIHTSMSGYGHSGPRRDWTSMNFNLQGYSGLMMLTGSESDPPIGISNSWNDYVGGLHAGFAIVQALEKRSKTGVGCRLDVSQFECSVATVGAMLLYSAVNGTSPPRLGNRSRRFAPQGVYRCAGEDQWCAISVQNDEQWRALLTGMGNPSWADETRFATPLGRVRCHDEIDEHLREWTLKLTHTEVETRLQQVGVPAERMRRIQDVIDSPDGSGVFKTMEEPRVGAMCITWLPLGFSSGPWPAPESAPSLGQHTNEVLRRWLNLSDREIQELEARQALV
jgi:crotonobetainyl-CoA:carnitine CoA-transferase CaiB-like acyl-CoA transferase